jgi:5-methylcytosine-specific restriction endonuclease McrA
VDNIGHWGEKLDRLTPITGVAVESVRFDMQKIENPEISGVTYQRGELFGYEVKEYLLEKWGRQCAYCDGQGIPLQIEHIVPKIEGGSDRLANLTLACQKCNQQKGSRRVEEFLKEDQERLRRIVATSKTPLKDAAAVNATRFWIGKRLKSALGKPTTLASGGRTKFNRTKQGYAKDHWIDAACVGENGEHVKIPAHFTAGQIRATGRGTRQICRVDKYGIPRTSAKTAKRVFGFQTGDIVKAVVPTGKKRGTYHGRVAVRNSGFFNIQTRSKTIEGISYQFCRVVHRRDGYTYD